MIALNPHSLCVQAEPHYYDFIFGEEDESVPEHIVRHIEGCENCQERLNQLKVALSRADGVDSKQRQADSAINTMLRLHFGYIGRPVTCRVVKPFLPTLLDPLLQVRTPTPITAHLDNCEQCSEDLKTIQAMNLNRKQLGRLSRLLAEDPAEDTVNCSEAQAAGLAVALLAFGKTNAEALKHLCLCPQCRQALYEYRESVRKDLLQEEQIEKEFPCEKVSATDVFDCCVPYGIDPAADQYAKFRESLASHLRSCPACLAKIQQLHNTVYGIVQRAESEVVTRYHLDEFAKVQTPTESESLYAGFPIRVEVANSKGQVEPGQPASASTFAAALRKRLSAINVKPLARIVAVAATVVIVAALLLNTQTAKAVTLADIYRALENVQNVYIAHFGPDLEEPAQEQWVSRKLGIHLIKTKVEIVLRDVTGETMKVKQLQDGSIESGIMSAEMVGQTRENMAGSLGLVPFTQLSLLPKGAEWTPANRDGLTGVAEGVEVYDLTWTEEMPNGPTVIRKWRYFVNNQTGLPQRVELYRKLVDDYEYALKSMKTVEYLSDEQIQEVVKEVFLGQ